MLVRLLAWRGARRATRHPSILYSAGAAAAVAACHILFLLPCPSFCRCWSAGRLLRVALLLLPAAAAAAVAVFAAASGLVGKFAV